MAETILRPRTYVHIFIVLEILTLATALVARIDLGTWNTVVALVIAVAKSSLVVLFFMHVRYSFKQTQLTVIIGLVWLLILLLLTMTDYTTRIWSALT